MVVNDNAGCLDTRGALVFFASVLAPTRGGAASHTLNVQP
jgi:hypothetical protein